jgi:hypothetical protein
MKRSYFFSFFLIFLTVSVQASVKRAGFSFIQNYPKQVYHAGTQVWSISQDSLGIFYFGNNSGLLTFDGKYWNLFPVPNGSIIRAVNAHHKGRIYVGASNEFGYFTPNLVKGLRYVSLLSIVPVEYRDFGEIWNIVDYKGGILFHSFNALFYLKDGKIEVVSFDRNLHFSFLVDGDFYVREINKGLLKLEGLQLVPVKRSEKFGTIPVTGMLPLDEKAILITTREHGLFILDSRGLREYPTELQQFLRDNQVFCAYRIDHEFYAFGTVQNGLIIMDRSGKLVQHLNRERGLQNNTILSILKDKYENLWMGLDNGIDMALINSPISYFAHQNDVGAVYAIERKDNFLYLGTNQGLFYAILPIRTM